MPKKRRVYNTRKKRAERLHQMAFCERCAQPFIPTKRYPYVCSFCFSVDARRQNGR